MSGRLMAADLASLGSFSEADWSGQRPIRWTEDKAARTVTLPKWVVLSLLADRDKLRWFEETHENEMDEYNDD